ncbi:hypothetical protein QUA81_23575 [Microcoleus sp. F6_B4]
MLKFIHPACVARKEARTLRNRRSKTEAEKYPLPLLLPDRNKLFMRKSKQSLLGIVPWLRDNLKTIFGVDRSF